MQIQGQTVQELEESRGCPGLVGGTRSPPILGGYKTGSTPVGVFPSPSEAEADGAFVQST